MLPDISTACRGNKHLSRAHLMGTGSAKIVSRWSQNAAFPDLECTAASGCDVDDFFTPDISHCPCLPLQIIPCLFIPCQTIGLLFIGLLHFLSYLPAASDRSMHLFGLGLQGLWLMALLRHWASCPHLLETLLLTLLFLLIEICIYFIGSWVQLTLGHIRDFIFLVPFFRRIFSRDNLMLSFLHIFPPNLVHPCMPHLIKKKKE